MTGVGSAVALKLRSSLAGRLACEGSQFAKLDFAGFRETPKKSAWYVIRSALTVR
jgi:hypothetical protein